MHWVWQVVGTFLAVAALVDAFQTIFHPTERGTISDAVGLVVWRTSQTISRQWKNVLTWAGPIAVLAIIVMWVSLIVLGFALIYWPRLDNSFSYANPADHGRHHALLDAINLSLDSVITMTGDISPNSAWMRLIMGFEAAFGFGILTASISWILSIYPILERRRSLAHSAILLRDVLSSGGQLTAEFAKAALATFAQQLVTLRSDFLHFPVTFYFHEQTERSGLGSAFSFLKCLSRWAESENADPSLRTAGTLLSVALNDVVKLLADYAGVSFESPEHAIGELTKEHLRDEPERAA